MSLHYEKAQARVGFGKEKETKFVGRRRLADPFTLERLAKEIAHETGMRQATCETVLRYMVLAVEDAIQDGRSVDIGIGTVSPTISTVASDTAEGVKVRKKRILFRPSKQLRTIVENMKVQLISEVSSEESPEDPDDSEPSGPSGGNDADTGTPSGGGTFTVAASVSGDGGTVALTKNGQAVSGSSVQATAGDTVVLSAQAEDGFQFMGWSDGNNQNPRTVTVSADLTVSAAFLDLSKV